MRQNLSIYPLCIELYKENLNYLFCLYVPMASPRINYWKKKQFLDDIQYLI